MMKKPEGTTVGPSGMEFGGHTPDGPIWKKPSAGSEPAQSEGIPPNQASQEMVERGIPIDWEHGDKRIDTSGMTADE